MIVLVLLTALMLVASAEANRGMWNSFYKGAGKVERFFSSSFSASFMPDVVHTTSFLMFSIGILSLITALWFARICYMRYMVAEKVTPAERHRLYNPLSTYGTEAAGTAGELGDVMLDPNTPEKEQMVI